MENENTGIRDRLTPVLILAVIGILILFLRLVAINWMQGDYDACWAYGVTMLFACFALSCLIPMRRLRIAKGLLIRFAAVAGLCAAGTALLFFAILWKPPHYFDAAVEKGQIRRIRRFLEKYPVAEGRRYEWERDAFDMAELEYQLCEAVEYGHLELIDVFIEYGVDLSDLRNERYSPLQTAMRHDSFEAFEKLLESGADPRKEAAELLTICSYAPRIWLERLLEEGLDPDTLIDGAPFLHGVILRIERGDRTPLMDGFDSGLAVIDLLLEHGADIDFINEGHRTAYMIAVTPALRDALGNRGAETVLRDEEGRTALHRAVDDENLGEIRRVLAEQPILVNLGKKYAETPLFDACFDEESDPAPPEILEILLDAGADADARNNHGATPLIVLPWHLDVLAQASVLLDRGADIDAETTNPPGITALSRAVEARNAGNIRFLLERGAEVTDTAWKTLERNYDEGIHGMLAEAAGGE